MRFIVGLITGAVIGAVATQASQGQAGQEIRAEFDRIRGDLEKRDFEALGAHLEERFAQLQASLEERFAQAAAAAAEAPEAATAAPEEAAAEPQEEEAEPVTA